MEDQEESKPMKDRVEEMTTRNFWIANCPEKIYNQFVDYAKRETENSYARALKELLMIAETDAKTILLYERMLAIEDRLCKLEGEDESSKSIDKRKKIATFGGGRNGTE